MNIEIPYAGDERAFTPDRGRVLYSAEAGGWLVPEQQRPADWQQRSAPKVDPAPPLPRDYTVVRSAPLQSTRAPHRSGAGRPAQFTKEELKAHKAEWQRAKRARLRAARPPRACMDCGTSIADREPKAKRCRPCAGKRNHKKAEVAG